MECNKEEAVRAKEIAEKRMQNGEFHRALSFALKAQQLYPALENISQLLVVCEVHSAALIKLNGSEMDWYGILQIDKFSDEVVIKKQYRKLALLLHPDKNKFAGAEAAFKLICEANRVLTDPVRRSLFDVKCRGLMRSTAPEIAPRKSNGKSHSKKQSTAANQYFNASYSQQIPNQQPKQPTFWTLCTSCGTKYQYYREYQNKLVLCQRCHQTFNALDFGVQGVPHGFSWSQSVNEKGVPNPVAARFAPQSNSGNPSGMNFSYEFVGLNPVPKPGKSVDALGSEKPEEMKARNGAEIGENLRSHEKANGCVDVASGKDGAPLAKHDTKKCKESGNSGNARRKRGRNSIKESSKSINQCSDASKENINQKNRGNISTQNSESTEGHQCWRSSRQKSHVSYKENLNDDNDFVCPSPKRPSSCGSTRDIDKMKAAGVDVWVLKDDSSAGSATTAAANVSKKEIKQKATCTIKESILNERKTVNCKAHGEESSVLEKPDSRLETDVGKSKADDESISNSYKALESNVFDCPDPDFSNFEDDKAEKCFAANQVWAMYDPVDSMPRFYARIKRILSPGFKLQISWLEASPNDKDEQDWCDNNLPVACGEFEIGGTEEVIDSLMFSHQMHCIKSHHRGIFFIYPMKGETWAIFKDWDMKWNSEPEKHKPPYQFEIVEILSDFVEDVGIGVRHLGKVKGFVSIFQQAVHNEVISFCIYPRELYRFSHRIPSFRMTGKEGDGVPGGSFELDPASLPSNLVGPGDLNNSKKERENLDTEAFGSCSNSPNKKVKSMNFVSQKICTPKKDESGYYDKKDTKFGQPKNQVAANQFTADHKKDMKYGQPNASAKKYGDIKSPEVSCRRVVEVELYDFGREKSGHNFQLDQIWALYSDNDGMPRNYAQVKKIEFSPGFRLHVSMLEGFSPPKGVMQSVCTGTYKVENGKTKVFPCGKFSHRMKAEPSGKNRYEIYPKKGEIWALYKNWSAESTCSDHCSASRECDFVEVLENNDDGVKVVVLIPVNGSESFYRVPRSCRSVIGVIDIPRTEFARFSHQCSAIKRTGEEDRRLRGFWELDPTSIPGSVILLD